MPTPKLGKSDLQLTTVGFGTWAIRGMTGITAGAHRMITNP